MSQRTCLNGHHFEKTSDCPVCPICSATEMQEKYAAFPKIGAPASRALNSIGIRSLEQLTAKSEAELLALHGMGPKAVAILKQVLAEKGLTLAK